MKTRGTGKTGVGGGVLAGACLLGIAPANAVVVQTPAGPGGPGALLAPPSAAFGRWGANATAMAIGPNHVLTTRHQDGNTASPPLRNVVFNGVTYQSVSQTVLGNTDLRVVQIAKLDNSAANLATYLPVWKGPTPLDQRVVIGGYGQFAGSFTAPAGSNPGGYGWAGTASNSNGLRFGDNIIEQSLTIADPNGFTSPTFVTTFEQAGAPGSTRFEASVAPGDSGGAWSLFHNDQWWILGLSNAVQFADPGQPAAFFGQSATAVNATALVSQIESAVGTAFPNPVILPEPALAALGLAGCVLMRRRQCRESL